jgi:hypothetical protein
MIILLLAMLPACQKTETPDSDTTPSLSTAVALTADSRTTTLISPTSTTSQPQNGIVLTLPSDFFKPVASPIVKNTLVIDNPIPQSYITYFDPNGLFSLSFPANYTIAADKNQEMEKASNEVTAFMDSKTWPTNYSTVLFEAKSSQPEELEVTVTPGYDIPETIATYVPPEPYSQSIDNDYPWTVSKTSVDGKMAIIMQNGPSYNSLYGTFCTTSLLIMIDRFRWNVVCRVKADDYSKYADDFKSIAGSLRILK